MANHKFGTPENVKPGDHFADRRELRAAGIQLNLQAGIDGNPKVGCTSIVLNGGYVDDFDLGDEIIYTGHGGNDPNTKRQVKDQDWEATGNKALIVSEMHGLPVRVTRGHKHKSDFSPPKGYRYAGLYRVAEHFEEIGKDGYKICRYRLLLEEGQEVSMGSPKINAPAGNTAPGRMQTTTLRVIRDTAVSRAIKKLYDYSCQVCGLQISTRGIKYAEAAHIKPLGAPHNGPDTIENLLCLCPNHHVMFDKGIIAISNSLELIGMEGSLAADPKHSISADSLEYHRQHIYSDQGKIS